ncbi:MAG: aminotransferase class I/II-fold pyridoxal phosphate-dependent enzyme [Candidatus Omnitrophota bacterium]
MDLRTNLSILQSPQTPPSLAAAVAYLLFREMRLDPANPQWSGGDVLIYSARYGDTVRQAYRLAGCAESSVPPAGLNLWTGRSPSITRPRRIFALLEAADAGNFPKLVDAFQVDAAVLCPEPPLDSHRWRIESPGELTLEKLETVFCSSRRNEALLWIVAPLTGAALFEPARSGCVLPPIANRMAKLGTETAFDVLAQVNRLRAEGRDIISFGLGEPDFDTPSHIKDAAKKALDKNETHYAPSAGIPQIREAIARYVQRTRRIPVDPAEVVVTPGAKPIMFDVMMSLINPGDEVIYPNPGYPIYESVIDWIGGASVPLPLLEEREWGFAIDDLARLITAKTKMIVLNTPGNPTGTLLKPELLKEIADLAIDRNLWVIADEVYSQIVFDAEFHSIASYPGMKERVIIVDGFSKTYAMTGWRLGYGVMNKDLAVQAAKIETNIDSCTCTFSQIAGVHALEGPQHESFVMVEQFKERAKVLVDGLNQIDGVRCLPAQGAFYLFSNVTGACRRLGLRSANELQREMLHQAGVAVLPRTCFGRKNAGEDREYIRLSFATSMENIREGLRRMKQFIER